MLFSGIIDVLFFTSMMSMMGMALNPMESQMAAETGGGAADGTDSSSEADSGGDGSQIGEADSDTTGDFGGFDSGGFGDF
jgi:hypothetical protein